MTVSIGLVGAGAIADAHARSCRDLGLPFAVSARGHAAGFAERWSVTEHDSYDALLDACDIVVVATPTSTHEELVTTALARGHDVICEKPLTLETAAAERLVDAVAKTGRALFPAHVVRWFPPYERLRHRVTSGEIGAMRQLELFRGGTSPWQSWFHEESGGGLVTDLMIHDYDQAMWLAGDVGRVVAHAWEEDGGEHAQVELTHADGTLSQVNGTWGPPGTPFVSWIRATGETGVLEHHSTWPTEPYESPYTSQLRDLVSACLQGTTPRVTLEDGVRAVRVAEAVRTSLRTCEPVYLG